MLYVPLIFALLAIAINQLSPDVCINFSTKEVRKYVTTFFVFVTVSIELSHSARLMKSNTHTTSIKGINMSVHEIMAVISYIVTIVFFVLLADDINSDMKHFSLNSNNGSRNVFNGYHDGSQHWHGC